MLASIHQPDFLSYLGFYHKIWLSDIFIVLDNVQFVSSNNSWTHRDKILTKNGPKWITISHKKNARNDLIKDIEISYITDWKSRSINLIKENYFKSDYYKEVIPKIEEIYNFSPIKLIDFNMRAIKIILDVLEINPKILFASEIDVEGKKNQLLINLLKKLRIKKYIAGDGSKTYMNIEKFEQNNIEVIWHNYKHPEYKQMHEKFEKNLSIIDCMFNIGIKKTQNLLKQK
jgi:hypothetical protein